MAVRVNKTTPSSLRRGKYAWDEWLDGSVWQGRHGEDFTCQVRSFVSQLYKAAYDRGLRIHIHPKGEGVVEWEAYTAAPEEDEGHNVA